MHVYSCENWTPVSVSINSSLTCEQFKTETLDLADLIWTPDDHAICVWDTCLEYKIFLYSPTGKCLRQYSAYEQALGIKSVAWSPSGELLAIGSYDQQVI